MDIHFHDVSDLLNCCVVVLMIVIELHIVICSGTNCPTAGPGNVENAMEEVVILLKYLIDQLETAQRWVSNTEVPN